MIGKRLSRSVSKAKVSEEDRRIAGMLMRDICGNDTEIVRRRNEIISTADLMRDKSGAIEITEEKRKKLMEYIKDNGVRINKLVEDNRMSKRELKYLVRTGTLPK